MIIKRKLFSSFPMHIDGKDEKGRFIVYISPDGKKRSPRIYFDEKEKNYSKGEEEFYNEFNSDLKKEKTTLRDRLAGTKAAVKAVYQNTKGSIFAPRKIKVISKPAEVGYDKKAKEYYRITEPEYVEKDYKIGDRLGDIGETVKNIPDFYRSGIEERKGVRVGERLRKKYNIK